MDQTVKENFGFYIKNEEHPIFLDQARALLDDLDEMHEAFSGNLAFGTGGLRGIIGAGTNRINPLSIKLSSQGLVNYAQSVFKEPLRAVISYDSRNYSRLFAEQTAQVFAANGVTAYIFDELHPVGALSFALRHYQCHFGVMITASHNPPNYNGYKVYWQDGAQVLPPHDQGIIKQISLRKIPPTMTLETAIQKQLIIFIGNEIDRLYIKNMKKLVFNPEIIKKSPNFKIVYTPLHGAGKNLIKQILEDNGFNVQLVDEQSQPDGNFTTVKSPNPEDSKALAMAVELGKKNGAHIVLATDPDADRMGVAVLHQGDFVFLTGNQIGLLLLDYICSMRKKLGTLPKNGLFINTIVSSPLQNTVARYYGLQEKRVLTGFKYIAQQIEEIESTLESTYIFGCEESYGYLCTTDVRDKDAVSTALVMAECAIWHFSQGRTLVDQLNILYQQFGYFKEVQITHDFPGSKGLEIMENFMQKLREKDQPWDFFETIRFHDYKYDITKIAGKSMQNKILPSSNVLEFTLNDGSIILVRPSGTEPKMKFYLIVKGENWESIDQKIIQMKSTVNQLLIT
jgi:phosphoglucomutase